MPLLVTLGSAASSGPAPIRIQSWADLIQPRRHCFRRAPQHRLAQIVRCVQMVDYCRRTSGQRRSQRPLPAEVQEIFLFSWAAVLASPRRSFHGSAHAPVHRPAPGMQFNLASSGYRPSTHSSSWKRSSAGSLSSFSARGIISTLTVDTFICISSPMAATVWP